MIADAFLIFAAVFCVAAAVYCWHVNRKVKRRDDEIEAIARRRAERRA